MAAAVIASAASASTLRIGALVAPLDEATEALSLPIAQSIEEALIEFPAWQVKRTDALFPVERDAQAAGALNRAEALFVEAKALRGAASATRLLEAIKEYARAAASLKACGHLCDAVAMLAAELFAAHDLQGAKLVVLDWLALTLGKSELDRKTFSPEFMSFKAEVVERSLATMRGALLVKTKPAGARVFINSELVGLAPVSVQMLAAGKTLVRVERPGFKQAGAAVVMGGEDHDVTLDLIASPAFTAFASMRTKLGLETIDDKGGAAMAAAGQLLGIERAIIAVLRDRDGDLELSLGYCELKTGKRLAFKRVTVRDEEYGQLHDEVGRLVIALILSADGPDERGSNHSRDPLDGKSGREEWLESDKGGRARDKAKKHKGGDPLDGMQGTEDW